jgi:hypothetical protein
LICAEGLSALFRKAENDRIIRGISICRGGPRVSHLFFADDSIIFCRATNSECTVLLQLLSTYEHASGQKVNGGKTAVFFSHNTPTACQESILQLFGTTTTNHFEKYLGLPPVIGKAKKQAFNAVKDRVWQRLQGWKEKLLSQAGREVLIKAVIQAIPTYAMSVFRFPLGLCSELSSLATNFWWGQRSGGRKIHWLSKQQLAKAKSKGGMGFRDLHNFNKALLARQAWRLLKYPNSLVSRFLKARYYPQQDFLDSAVKGNVSYTWRSICESKGVLKVGMRFRVGTGSAIKIWQDPWLVGSSSAKVLSPVRILDSNASVDALINSSTMEWKSGLIDQIFMPSEAEIIKQIPLSYRRPKDLIIWSGTKKGEFTVKSAYRILNQQECNGAESSSVSSAKFFWKGVWSSKVQPKIRNFIWRACRNILPTQTKLFEKQISSSFSCRWCETEAETCDHVLWRCEFAQRVWSACAVKLPSRVVIQMTVVDFLECCLQELASPDVEIIFTTAWMLWSAQNALLWEGQNSTVSDICTKSSILAIEYLEVGDSEDHAHIPSIGREGSQWIPPLFGSYKMSIACKMSVASAHVGFGFLIRDWEGRVLAASGFVGQRTHDSLINFSAAVFFALQFAYETGFRCNVVVEVPSRELLSLLHFDQPSLAPIGVLIDDIGDWLPFFQDISFSFISMECNKASHALAVEAVSSNLDQVWLEECPPCVCPFV